MGSDFVKKDEITQIIQKYNKIGKNMIDIKLLQKDFRNSKPLH